MAIVLALYHLQCALGAREKPHGKETNTPTSVVASKCPRNTHIGPEKSTQDLGLMEALRAWIVMVITEAGSASLSQGLSARPKQPAALPGAL